MEDTKETVYLNKLDQYTYKITETEGEYTRPTHVCIRYGPRHERSKHISPNQH